MFFPAMKPNDLRRVTLERFPGLDRREAAETGGFREMRNLSADGYPTLCTRPKRSIAAQTEHPHALTAKDCLYWVDGTRVYANGLAIGPLLTEGKKQLVSMGAYLIVFLDGIYVNTQNTGEYGTLACSNTAASGVEAAICDENGTAYSGIVEGTAAPEDAADGMLWMDLSTAAPTLRQYTQQIWTAVENICVKLSATGLGIGFAAGDGVEISGCTDAQLNGQTVLRDAGADWILFHGQMERSFRQTAPVTVCRKIPQMDFVVQSGNRLWGCKYGMVEGETVNAIYASKLGDFKNWNCFAGLSTDSYAAARGSDGAFTGAISYLGDPIFFKEECMERVYAGAGGAHQIVTTECAGVQSGSGSSLQVVDGVLYYLSRDGVQAFDGSLPISVSQALGEARYHGGVAGAWRGKYYLSVLDEENCPSMLVYDRRKRLWHREDELRAAAFAATEEDLFCLAEDGALWAMHGSRGEKEKGFAWYAESGEMGMSSPEHKRLLQLLLYLQAEQGSRVTVAVSYDRGESWQVQGEVIGCGMQEQVLAIRPQYCRRLRIRLSGEGICRLYALTAVYEKGSDGL